MIIHSLVGKWNYSLYLSVSVHLPHIYLDWNTVVFLCFVFVFPPFFPFFMGGVSTFIHTGKQSVTALEVAPVDEQISFELYYIMFLIHFALI